MSQPSADPPRFDPSLPIHPADAADLLQRLAVDESRSRLRDLPTPQAAQVLSELEDDHAAELMEELSAEEIAAYLGELSPRIAADLAGFLPGDRRTQVLSHVPRAAAESIEGLLRFPDDSAGGIMSDRFIRLRAQETVAQCQQRLRDQTGRRPEDIAYLYVTDPAQRLVGVVPLRELVFANPERRVGEIMIPDVKSVYVDADQESVSQQFAHYHFLALPVIDRQGRMMGIIRANDVLTVAREEATEDMQLMVGLSGEERTLTPWRKAVPRRLPWLYINLATAFLAAFVIGLFESTIERWTALVVFLPIVAGQGGNAGMQTLTVIIRDLALGEISLQDGRKALAKEMALALVNGIAVGLVVGAIGWMWKGSLMLGVVAGLAMMLNQLAAAAAGVAIPLGLKACKIDPALASSIFLTTVTDVAGFFFFLGLAALALHWFPVP